ncbi:MAG: helix-turn-helix domain-containing protein [Oscillospiraceae bacterium]|nr:helix-turn-helix domain-containing protein [Oscillospiraceae bacterium]
MALSENIYTFRTAKFMSQEELAEALGVSRQSVSKWETGASTPELDKLIKMSELFGVTLDQLVKFQNGSSQSAILEEQGGYIDLKLIEGNYIELVEIWRMKSAFEGTATELEKYFENLEKRSENYIWNPSMGAVPMMRLLGADGQMLSPMQAPVSAVAFSAENGSVMINIPTDAAGGAWLSREVRGIRIYEKKAELRTDAEGVGEIRFKTDNYGLICPISGSDKMQAFKKGFSAGSATIGAVLLGPLGILAGAIGSDEIYRVCMSCGHHF